MTVIHIVSSISPLGGGPARSSQGLVAALESAGVTAWLMPLKERGLPYVAGINHYLCPGLEGWRGVRKAVEQAIDKIHPDIIHIHSIWQFSLHQAVVAARQKHIPYVIAPRGTIETWSLKQKWLKKKVAMLVYQGKDLKKAAAIHVTAGSEAQQCRKLGFSQPLIFSPNGVNVPAKLPIRETRSDGNKRVLFVSRIHYKKGLENLVRAWASVCPVGWKMEIVGTDEDGYRKDVERLVAELGVSKDFIFTGPLDDNEKWNAYGRADLFVLPSFSENFGIVIAEALWAGVPVITTKGTPWSELESCKCGWWIDVGVEPLVSALKDAMSLDDSVRKEMGGRGQKLVSEKYTWSAVVKPILSGYKAVLNNDSGEGH